MKLLPSLVAVLVLGISSTQVAGLAPAVLPAALSDKAFWALSEDLSEQNGFFQSDNLLSNEIVFARLVPELVARVKPGGVYLGVGPEQNFTYIAAIRPRIAFITDIRRGNLHTQLMYKALFELSADRAEFVSRLFTKKRAAGLSAASTVTEIMTAYWDTVTGDEAAFAANLAAIQQHLTKTRALPLSAEDLEGIASVYRAFYWYGPAMNYSASTSLNMAGVGRGVTYWDLMTQSDGGGQTYSYLASEEKFRFLRELQRKNLVVPVVGDFAGPKALRAVGAYVKARGATVSAFYLSNVESYLRRNGVWPAFCANVATMPLDDASVFIRPSGSGSRSGVQFLQFAGASGGQVRISPARMIGNVIGSGAVGLVPMAAEVKECAAAAAR